MPEGPGVSLPGQGVKEVVVVFEELAHVPPSRNILDRNRKGRHPARNNLELKKRAMEYPCIAVGVNSPKVLIS